MASKNDGGPAFPWYDEKGYYTRGMSLRSYYKAAALQGMLASQDLWDAPSAAREAGRFADAMLAEDAEFEGKP